MSIERLKERESVRKNILKQASLNEELMYKSKPTFEAFRDTLYSSGARFQLLKSGLTNRIKQSTNNIEKVSGMSIKNGFVRILQVADVKQRPYTLKHFLNNPEFMNFVELDVDRESIYHNYVNDNFERSAIEIPVQYPGLLQQQQQAQRRRAPSVPGGWFRLLQGQQSPERHERRFGGQLRLGHIRTQEELESINRSLTTSQSQSSVSGGWTSANGHGFGSTVAQGQVRP